MRKVGALLAVLGGSLVLAQAANATLPAKGANFQCGYAASTQSTVLSDMLSAGSAWTRVSVDWNSLEAAGRNVWSSSYLSTLTSCFTAIHTYDSNVLIVLGPHTPNWAAASGCNNANGLCPPANDLYYEEAAAKLAQTFPASNGSDGINAFEFWNEPNSGSFWAGTAPEYGAMEADGYAGVKAHSTATTVFGGTSHFAYSWLQQAIQYGQFDVLGVHPYPNDATDYYDNPAHYLNLSGSNNSLTGYRSLLCTYGPDGCSTPIWFTESGFIVDGGPQLSFSQIATGLTDQFHYLANGCTGCANVKQDDWFVAWVPTGNEFVPQALIAPGFTLNAPYYALQNLNPCYPSICQAPLAPLPG